MILAKLNITIIIHNYQLNNFHGFLINCRSFFYAKLLKYVLVINMNNKTLRRQKIIDTYLSSLFKKYLSGIGYNESRDVVQRPLPIQILNL